MYYTFIMLKPDALEKGLVKEIVKRLLAIDVKIEMIDYTLVDDELIFKHYKDNIAQFGDSFKSMAHGLFTGKFVIPVILSSKDPDIIHAVRKVIGATDPVQAGKGTIRGDLGVDSMEIAKTEKRGVRNLIHASDSREAYLYESKLWFGETAEQYR